jgi:CMP-N,N'-diacetyllegionaminic acid synthase
MNILGITPARGGSKTIPKKNIKEIAGKPLISWTIEAARASTLLTDYVVSTENKEIAEIAKRCNAQVLDRPRKLSTDKTTTLAVMQDVLQKIPADIVVLLQCTSPVREKGLIDKCIKTFLDKKADSLATGFICNLYEWGGYDNKRRQDLKGWFHDDGNVYVVKAKNILKGELWGEKREQFPISREQNFEIDDEFDFWLNKKILLWKNQQ